MSVHHHAMTVRLPTAIPRLERRFLGLNSVLWRLASVVAVAQFGWSIWYWQFSVFLAKNVDEWQIGIVLASGTVATLLGYPISGALSDLMGRKKTMLLSFVPISAGLALLAMRPEWPLVVFEYALAAFGWSFIMVVERAMAADVVIEDKGRDSARTFSMIIAPAIFVDGLAPLVASGLLVWGLTQDMLISIGAVTSLLALVIAPRVLRETLTEQTMDRARAGSKVPIRSFGLNYWKTILGMAGFYFASGMTLSYFGNLFVDEWYLDLPTFGLTWTAFSFTQALLTYTVSGLADRNLRASLFLAVLGNWFLIGVSGVGGGVALAFAVNMTSAPLMILWMGAENSIIAANVTEEAQGRAMGVYNLLLNSLNIIAAPLGAMLWISTGSLRSVFIITTIASAPLLLVLGFILRGITAHPSSQESEIAVTP